MTNMTIVIAITLIVAATFLFLWMRRDRGDNPRNDLS